MQHTGKMYPSGGTSPHILNLSSR